MDLTTTYLGKRLANPFVVGAGPLGDDLDMVKALEDAGASMLVLRSLFEEEITGEQMEAFFYLDGQNDSFSEAGSFGPEPEAPLGPDQYLEHLREVKRAVGIPRIKVRLSGAIATFTPSVTIDVFKGRNRIHHGAVAVKRAGTGGTFSLFVKPGGRGVYRIRATDAGGSTSCVPFGE